MKLDGTREAKNKYIHDSSNSKGCPNCEAEFSVDLQDVLDRVPQADVLIMLGDINACVVSDLWGGVFGKQGMGEVNQVGEEFLEFCATNQLTIMNTWFAKKQIHLGTWLHPAPKRYTI